MTAAIDKFWLWWVMIKKDEAKIIVGVTTYRWLPEINKADAGTSYIYIPASYRALPIELLFHHLKQQYSKTSRKTKNIDEAILKYEWLSTATK
jgi:hypothetical protein